MGNAARTLYSGAVQSSTQSSPVTVAPSRSLAELEQALATTRSSNTELRATLEKFRLEYIERIDSRVARNNTRDAERAEALSALRPDDTFLRFRAGQTRAIASRLPEQAIERHLVPAPPPEPLIREAAVGDDAAPLSFQSLYRAVARGVHPDLGTMDDAGSRHAAMTEANHAYESGDRATLERLLAVCGGELPEAAVAPGGLARARVEARLALAEQDRLALEGSRVHELYAHSIRQASFGHDLLAEIVAALHDYHWPADLRELPPEPSRGWFSWWR